MKPYSLGIAHPVFVHKDKGTSSINMLTCLICVYFCSSSYDLSLSLS